MKTKSKKIVCVALAVLLIFALSIVIAGCGEKEPKEPKYEPPKNCDVVLESESGWNNELYENFIALCNTYDEIQEKLINHGAELSGSDNDKVLEYAKEHAEDKSFVVCFYVVNGYNGQQRLREVEVNDGKLTMYIWCPRNTIVNDVMGNCLFIAGVDKSFVANVTECEYVFI